MRKWIKIILDRLRGEPSLKKLCKNGLTIGSDFSYGSHCFFDPSHCFLISIGNNVTFSTRVHLLAHDASTAKLIGYTKIGRIDIGDNVFVGANTTILPGVVIGDNSVIGAGSLVSKDIEPDSVYAGVPAKRICSIQDYIDKIEKISQEMRFGEEYTMRGGVSEAQKQEMKSKLKKNKIGLIR